MASIEKMSPVTVPVETLGMARSATGHPPTVTSALLERTDAALTFIEGPDLTTSVVSRDEILSRSLRLAHGLRELGMEPGDRVLMMIPTGASFVTALFALWFNGAISVPVVHRASPRGLVGWRDKVSRIMRTVSPRFAIGTDDALAQIDADDNPSLRCRRVPLSDFAAIEARAPETLPEQLPDESATAHCQFTSGSTGNARGILITHGQIANNLASAAQRVGVHDDDRFLSWLPLHHDMGFIGGLLFPLYTGMHQVLVPTETFARAPHIWPQLIDRHRVSLSPAPTFAYELLTSRVPSSRLKGIDLSCWRYAWVGAEPVFAQTLAGFRARFAAFGFPSHALAPCYGLAEATLAVTSAAPGTAPNVIWVKRNPLQSDGIVETGREGAAESIPLVSVGRPLSWADVHIVATDDAKSGPVEEGHEGLIIVNGPCTRDSEWTPEGVVSHEGPLDTGDLGFMLDGELYITGRAKDVLIRGGVNTHPHWIERVAEKDPCVRPGRVAAVSFFQHERQRQEIVLVVEPTRFPPKDVDALKQRLAESVAAETGLQLDRVECVSPGTVPKTSSGKVQRRLTALRLARGELVS